MRVDLGQTQLEVRVEGTPGAPWVTLAHPIMTDLSIWDEAVDALARDYRVLRFDARGHGASAAPTQGYSIDDLATDVIGIWRAVGVERSAFIGLSLGAMTGLALALNDPEAVWACVLCDLRADAPAEFSAPWPARIAVAESDGVGAVGDPMIERWLSEETKARAPEVASRLKMMVRRTSVAGYREAARALLGLNYLGRASDLQPPTMFLAGGEDRMFLEPTRTLAGLARHGRFVEIPLAGHAPNLEQPALFNAGVRAFLDPLRPTATP